MGTPPHFFNDCVNLSDEFGGPIGANLSGMSVDESTRFEELPTRGEDFSSMSIDPQMYLRSSAAWPSTGMAAAVTNSSDYPEDPLQPKLEYDEDTIYPLRSDTLSARSSRSSFRPTPATSSHLSESSKSTEPQPLERRESDLKKIRGRKRKKTAEEVEEAKRENFLERNRLAASKCRQKKKEWEADLQETKHGLECQNSRLHMEYSGLLGQVTAMKNELMNHANCNDRNIDRWLTIEAQKFVERASERHVGNSTALQ
jgi:hypothetical protein